ncbi:hypothetical protein OXX69_004885 [Metschnikowia pulcherrima]
MALEHGPARKNPFAPRKSTTVKRGKDEVYPHRKGLNRPEFMGDSPLDVLFQDLETKFSESLESVTVESLGKTFFPAEFESLSQNTLRYMVVERLLDYLVQIQDYSLEAQAKSSQKDLITISLHDIKTFGKLVNLIILLGVYPATCSFGIGVPIEKRRLNDFGRPSYRALKVQPILANKDARTAVEKYAAHFELLSLLHDKFMHVFSTDSDARNLLMKGSGFSDFMVVTITLMTVPHFEMSARLKYTKKFAEITEIATTYELYQDYSLLIQTPSPAYFKTFVMQQLQLLPSQAPKGDGVLTLVEFVLGLRNNDEIDIEKFDHVTSVLLSKPKSVSSVEYFSSLGTQCYDILVNINRPTISACVGHFIEKLWAKNHRIVQDFFLKRIWQNFNPSHESEKAVLVSERDVNNNVNVLISLTNRGLPKELLHATFSPILIPFWSYYCFLKKNGKPAEVAQNVLVSFFTQISIDEEDACVQLDRICQNLVAEEKWKFRLGPNQLVEIYSSDVNAFERIDAEKKVLSFMASLDNNCSAFLALVEQLDDNIVKKTFVSLLSKWVDSQKDAQSLDENPFMKLVDLRLLENMGNKFKDRLAQTPLDILQLVQKVLGQKPTTISGSNDIVINESDDIDSDDEDETENPHEVVNVVLELLSAIISETQPAELDETCRVVLADIRKTLSEKYNDNKAGQSLATRIGLILEEEKAPDSELELEKRAFTRAITNLNDPLVPIRAHGLYLLRQLVEQKSAVISVDFVVNLHLVQLKDTDPFIYLNAIKGLDALLALDDSQVLPVLTAIYRGNEKRTSVESESEPSDLDERLRVGEVLLRYIQAQDEAFSGKMAQLVCESALALIRRPASDTDMADNRLRMSAMSLLGTCCNTNILGILDNVGNAVDCAIGVLQLETDKDAAIMRRAAIVLINDLVCGTSKSDKVPFPKYHIEKVLTVLRYIESHDSDLLVREQASSVLQYIDELVKEALTVE